MNRFLHFVECDRVLPGFVYGWLARTAGIRMLEKEIPDLRSGELEFWKANFTELYSGVVTKDIAIGRLTAGSDFVANYELPQGGPAGWGGRVLILESAVDSMITSDDREAIKAHYPDAGVHTETRYGHTGTLVRSEASVAHVRRFLGSKIEG